MSDDALERLKNRQRPSVPARDASLTSSSVDISIPRYLEVEKPLEEAEVKTKQTTIRLETEVSNRLSEVCKSNSISREVLIEALFEYYETDPNAWNKIITQAKSKNEKRMRNANIKRAKSMMQKFG